MYPRCHYDITITWILVRHYLKSVRHYEIANNLRLSCRFGLNVEVYVEVIKRHVEVQNYV